MSAPFVSVVSFNLIVILFHIRGNEQTPSAVFPLDPFKDFFFFLFSLKQLNQEKQKLIPRHGSWSFEPKTAGI